MGSIFGSTPKVPTLPMPPPAAHPATLADAAVQGAGGNTKAGGAAANGMGSDGTIKTSPQGTPAPTIAKTLLGQ
jgi:hypothetical protein